MLSATAQRQMTGEQILTQKTAPSQERMMWRPVGVRSLRPRTGVTQQRRKLTCGVMLKTSQCGGRLGRDTSEERKGAEVSPPGDQGSQEHQGWGSPKKTTVGWGAQRMPREYQAVETQANSGEARTDMSANLPPPSSEAQTNRQHPAAVPGHLSGFEASFKVQGEAAPRSTNDLPGIGKPAAFSPRSTNDLPGIGKPAAFSPRSTNDLPGIGKPAAFSSADVFSRAGSDTPLGSAKASPISASRLDSVESQMCPNRRPPARKNHSRAV